MRTGHRPSAPRCTLARFIPESPDSDRIKKEAWENDGILVVHAADIRLTWIERQIIEGIGHKIFGKQRRG